MTNRKTIKIRRKPMFSEQLEETPRVARVMLVSICFFILFYALIFNTELALNMLSPSQPGEFLGIGIVVILLVVCGRGYRRLTRPYEIIINANGIGCLDWTFTLLPWERIDYISEGILEYGENAIPVLKIFLKEPLRKSVLPYHHSFLVRLYHWRRRGNGMEHQPIILDMRGLDKDISDVINLLTVHYPKKGQY